MERRFSIFVNGEIEICFLFTKKIINKIRTNYNGCAEQFQRFYDEKYMPVKTALMNKIFSDESLETFEEATQIFNDYYDALQAFSREHNVTSQSKFEPTFLEEISVYLFKDLPEIKSSVLGVYNKKIFAGIKINRNKTVEIITKDVDFCIGKGTTISIGGERAVSIVLPVIAVEVKTFLDATMFGEVKSSSKEIRSASPNAKTYVLMGFKSLADTLL